jgi:hypothetical protein
MKIGNELDQALVAFHERLKAAYSGEKIFLTEEDKGLKFKELEIKYGISNATAGKAHYRGWFRRTPEKTLAKMRARAKLRQRRRQSPAGKSVSFVDHHERIFELRRQLRDLDALDLPCDGSIDKVLRWWEARLRMERESPEEEVRQYG